MRFAGRAMHRVVVTAATDSELAAAIATGQEEAIAEVYRRYGPAIYGLALRIVQRADLAQEVLEEVIVGLWERPAHFNAELGSLRPWLLRIAHGKAVDHLRAETRRHVREERSTAGDAQTDAGDIEGQVWETVRAGAVREALSELNPAERQAIALAYFAGKTYRDVAQTLDIPEGTAKSRIRLGLDKLAGSLALAGLGPAPSGVQP